MLFPCVNSPDHVGLLLFATYSHEYHTRGPCLELSDMATVSTGDRSNANNCHFTYVASFRSLFFLCAILISHVHAKMLHLAIANRCLS